MNLHMHKNSLSCQALLLSAQCKKENAGLHSCELFILLVIDQSLKWSHLGGKCEKRKVARGKRLPLLSHPSWCLQVFWWFLESRHWGDFQRNDNFVVPQRRDLHFRSPSRSYLSGEKWHYRRVFSVHKYLAWWGRMLIQGGLLLCF